MTTANVLMELRDRGLVHETTDWSDLEARMAQGPITAYYGCDPTADSLHLGNLIGLLVLRRLHDAGHRVIALAGGATGMIGDPGGRSEERNLLDEATLRANVASIKTQIARIVSPDSESGALLVDNWDWTSELTLVDFLRDVGKHATVNQMMRRDSVRNRLESEHGISYTEFSYMLLQAHDYLHLHDSYGCELQVGGSDQWGNIVSGVDLVRRMRGKKVHALSWPLLTAPDGTKLGKTTGARTWLSAERTSPYQLFQHLMQIDDAALEQHLKWFTLLPLAEIATLLDAHEVDPSARPAHRALAHHVTALVHGEAAADAAQGATDVLFGGDPTAASAAALATAAGEMPVVAVSAAEMPLVSVALREAELVASSGEARRAIAQGGVYVNGVRLADDRPLSAEDLLHGEHALLRKGKRAYAMAVLTP